MDMLSSLRGRADLSHGREEASSVQSCFACSAAPLHNGTSDASEPAHCPAGDIWRRFLLGLGYSASKAALNMLTVQLAAELQQSGIKVNAVDPGFTATDLNQYRGAQTLAEGAAAALHMR